MIQATRSYYNTKIKTFGQGEIIIQCLEWYGFRCHTKRLRERAVKANWLVFTKDKKISHLNGFEDWTIYSDFKEISLTDVLKENEHIVVPIQEALTGMGYKKVNEKSESFESAMDYSNRAEEELEELKSPLSSIQKTIIQKWMRKMYESINK